MAFFHQDSVLNKPIAISNLFWIIFSLILIGGNMFFFARYCIVQKNYQKAQVVLEKQSNNKKILEFTDLFINEVLRAGGEVNFNSRLKLENTVRDLNDEEILAQWQEFVDSETDLQAQVAVKNLLSMLISKMETE